MFDLQMISGFQSTLPVRGGTSRIASPGNTGRFQSTLPVRGGTCGTPGFEGVFAKFQSTLPVGGGTLAMQARCPAGLISIHSPRGGRDGRGRRGITMYAISIHPPRVGRDALQPGKLLFRPISIHPPRKGRDLSAITVPTSLAHFNPPSPQGEGQDRPEVFSSVGRISIHPPREGRDSMIFFRPSISTYFNPPSP